MVKISVENQFGPDGARRNYSASVSFEAAGRSRAVLRIEADAECFALLADLLDGDRPDAPEALLLDALSIGLDFMWRRDSGCECLCEAAREDGPWPFESLDA